MHGRRLELATRARRSDRSRAQTLSRRGERLLHSSTRLGCLHPRKERIEFAAERIELRLGGADSALKFSTEMRTALGASCFVITTVPP